MTTTLAGLAARVAAQLADAGSRIYPADLVAEALRQALGEYGAAAGEAVTVQDLDGAASTTLPPLYESLIVMGAAAFAVGMRAVDRADSFQDGRLPDELEKHNQTEIKVFRARLADIADGLDEEAEQSRLDDLHSAGAPPWPTDETQAWDNPV